MVGLEVVRLGLAPHKAGELGYFSLFEVEAVQRTDFGNETGGEDGADAWDGLQGVWDGDQLVSDGGCEPLLLAFQEGDVFERKREDSVNRMVESLG